MSLISAKKVETNLYELEVKVEASDFKIAIEKAYKKEVKKISIPGFRKGKASKAIIEKMYGENFFWEEAVNISYPVAYEAAVVEAGIIPIDRADVEIKDISEEGFDFIAKVTVKPEIKIGEYKGLTADMQKSKVTTEEIEQDLDALKERNSRLVTVEGRKIEEGDNANINFEGFDNGVPFEGGKGDDFELVIGSGQFIPGFEEQIIGKDIGEEFEVNVSFPEEYHSEDLKGKAVVFKVLVNSATKKELPELDDDFAKDVSEFETLKELKADLKAKIKSGKEKTEKELFENRLIDKVIETMEGEIPEVMYGNAAEELMKDFEQRLISQGMKLDMYLQYTGTNEEDFKDSFKDQAKKRVEVRLVLEKIAELEDIKNSEEDLEAEYKNIAETYNIPSEQIKGLIDSSIVETDLKMTKSIEIIRESAKANMVDEIIEEKISEVVER